MCVALRLLPPPGSDPTLVARITSLRRSLLTNHLPNMVSDSPPRLPGTHHEYASAVSTKVSPTSTAASSCRKLSASLSVQPYTLVPRQITGTASLDFPSFLFFIGNTVY